MKVKIVVAVMIIVSMLGFVGYQLTSQCLAGDEALFIRMTNYNLLEYKTYPEWFTREGNIHPNDSGYLPITDYWDKAYADPIWHHPPLANYLAYPIVKLVWNDANLATIDAGTVKLRVVAWFMFSSCVLAAFWLVWKRYKSPNILLLSTLPFIASIPFFLSWGQNWFYHDMFVLVFFTIALLLRKTKYEKYIYIPLACMVACKGTAVFLLLPFIWENKKVVLCSLSLIPYFLQCYLVTGDFIYPLSHYFNAISFTQHATFTPILRGLGYSWELLAIMATPLVYTAYMAFKKKTTWFNPLLFITVFSVCLLFGGERYQLAKTIIPSILLISEAYYLWRTNRIENSSNKLIQPV